MAAKVTVHVQMPDGTPAVGARLEGVNHDAWAKGSRNWMGTTDGGGAYSWSAMDTGMFGDHYTFSANLADKQGEEWVGSVSERIKKDIDFTIVLRKTTTQDGNSSPASAKKGDKPAASPASKAEKSG